ncbi:uncharacterized protein LOC142159471 [Mixophyes fleayi]|uniref:uncharacterized protein LOC142159471 n=1 Tax=Mixophyes fleayi TaxID=3061075 RepID=UPI003F4DF6E9
MRAAIFSRRELRVLTEGMDNVPLGRYVSNELKLRAYQRIRRDLRLHYQTRRTIVQLQRRWSELRRRQPRLLDELRKEIRRYRERWERRQRCRPVVEAEEEEGDLHPLPEQPLPTVQQPEQLMPTAQQQPVQAEGTGDTNDNGEADPETEVEGHGEGDEEWADISEAEPQSSTSASGVAESELEAAPEPVAHSGQEDNWQLVLPQVDEALGETQMEEDDSWPPFPHQHCLRSGTTLQDIGAKSKNCKKSTIQ